MPKVPNATADELAEAQSALQKAIDAAKAEAAAATAAAKNQAQTQLNEAEKRLQGAIGVTTEAIKKSAAAVESNCKEEVHQLHQTIKPKLDVIDPKIEDASDKLVIQIEAVDKKADDALALEAKIESNRTRVVQEIAALREELVAMIHQTGEKAADALKQRCLDLDKRIDSTIKMSTERADTERSAAQAALSAFIEKQHSMDSDQDERSQRAQGEIYLRLDRLDSALIEAEDKAEGETKDAVARAAESVVDIRTYADGRFGSLDEETTRLRNAMSEVENISTRRVEWVINNVSSRLKPQGSEGDKASLHTSWFSPKFDAAGAYGLQLEFQLFTPSDPPVEDERAGDCAVFLWASKGLSLSYKLYVGGKSQTLEKVFNGRVPYGTKRFCWLKDQVNRQEDSLRIGVEILEAVREVQHVIRAPPTNQLADGSAEDGEAPPDKLEGAVLFHRHVNNRMLEQVKQQVERMNSRMVRRIEWRVEQASMLRKCFPPGEPICCKPFNAAGIDGMQMVFYPSGYKGATDGFCSFFLFCPAGATLKCSLCAGTQKRDASHSFAEPGAFGRTNFCRFEAVIDDSDDTIFMVLEIDEAHQDLVAKVSHPAVAAGDQRSQGQLEGAAEGPVDSVVKLKRVPGKSVPGLEDVRVLPSLWSAKPLGDSCLPPDGFHTMAELKKLGKMTSGSAAQKRQGAGSTSPQAASGGGASPSGRPAASSAKRSESLPSLGGALRPVSPAEPYGDDELNASSGSWRKGGPGRRPRGKDSMNGMVSMTVS